MKCVICGKAITDHESYHQFHDSDCPKHELEIAETGEQVRIAIIGLRDYTLCDCDNPCHAACCPVCNREQK